MCGRFELADPEEIYRVFHIKNKLIEIKPNMNVSPTHFVPVVVGEGELELMRWGLIPSWAKDAKIGYKMINARAEGIEDKPSFKKPLHFQRCVIPATGFYEWKTTKEGKVPFLFHLKDDALFGFAGLYDIWMDPEGKELKTFTIITTTPNTLVREVHDRMPVILSKEDRKIWLNPDTVEDEILLPLLKPYPADEMKMTEAAKSLNRAGIIVDSK